MNTELTKLRYFLFFIFLSFSFLGSFLKASDEAIPRSPTCLSDRPPGCYDARVYRNHLNYAYQGTVLSGEVKSIDIGTADAWHGGTQILLQHALKTHKAFIGSKNIALAAIQIIYEEGNELRVSEGYVNLPYIYFSGSESDLMPSTPGPPNRMTMSLPVGDLPPHFSLEGRPSHYVIKTVGDFLPGDGDESTSAGNVASKLRILLQNYFHIGLKPTKFNPDVFGEMHGAIGDNDLSYIQQYYFHSEQAFLIHLRNQPDVLNSLLASLPADSIIHQISLHIVSDRQMCRCCSRTCFRAAEGAGGIKEILKGYIEAYPHKGFQMAQDQVRLFVECSGLRPFQPPAAAHRERHAGKLDLPIQCDIFSPHVAHENIGKTSDEIVVK